MKQLLSIVLSLQTVTIALIIAAVGCLLYSFMTGKARNVTVVVCVLAVAALLWLLFFKNV
jgi:hypothetical protein